jgi:integrase
VSPATGGGSSFVGGSARPPLALVGVPAGVPPGEHTGMDEISVPLTPPNRRLQQTDVPGVYRRGNRFVAITRSGGKRIKTYHLTKAEAALAKADRTWRSMPPSSREPFDRYVERWVVEYAGRTARGLQPETRAAYALLLRRHAVPFFGQTAIGDLGPLEVRRFVLHLAQVRSAKGMPLRPSTVRRIMCPLKAMLAEAYELGLARVDAGRVRIVLPDPDEPEPPRVLTAEQLDAVLSLLAEPDRRLFELLSLTGLRISEALGLQWHDLQQRPGGPVLVLRRQCRDGRLRDALKTPAARRAVAVVPALAVSRDGWRHGASDDRPVFPSRASGHQDSHNVRRRLRRATATANVPWATPHTFRHTFASRLFDAGYDAKVIAAVLGHRDESFTRRTYIHIPDAPRFDALPG